MAEKDEIIERFARGMYFANLEDAKQEFEKLDFDASELAALLERLRSETETAQILILSSYIEYCVLQLLKAQMHHVDSSAKENDLFGSNGPLANFSSRVMLAYHLGWLSQKQKDKLDALRRIRNEFAHLAFRISFSDQKINDLFRNIDFDSYEQYENIAAKVKKICGEENVVKYQEMEINTYNLFNFAVLINDTIVDMIVLPTIQSFNIDPRSIFSEYPDSAPESLQGIFFNLAKMFYTILVIKNE